MAFIISRSLSKERILSFRTFRKVFPVLMFFVMIGTLIYMTQTVTLETYRTKFLVGVIISFIGLLSFWTLFLPDSLSALLSIRGIAGSIFTGLIILTLMVVFSGGMIMGALREPKVLRGKCYLETIRTGGRSNNYQTRVVFPEKIKGSETKIGKYKVTLNDNGYSAIVMKDYDKYANVSGGYRPDLGQIPCKSELEVTAVDTPLGFDHVLEVKEL